MPGPVPVGRAVVEAVVGVVEGAVVGIVGFVVGVVGPSVAVVFRSECTRPPRQVSDSHSKGSPLSFSLREAAPSHGYEYFRANPWGIY